MPALPLLLLLWISSDATGHRNGVELFRQHKYREAIPVLVEASSHESKTGDEYRESAMLIAQSYFNLSKAVEAIPWLESVPPSNESSYMLGYAYRQAGNAPKSVGAFAQLFGVTADSASAHLMAAQMLLKKNLEDEGAKEAEEALKLDPRIPEAHYVVAEVMLFHGNVAESIKHLEDELAINPGFSLAWYRLGDAYTRRENWDTAIVNLQRAVWLNPGLNGPYILLGKCYSRKNDPERAIRFLRQALKLDSTNYTATFLLGRALIAAGNEVEGKELLRKAATLASPSSEIERPHD